MCLLYRINKIVVLRLKLNSLSNSLSLLGRSSKRTRHAQLDTKIKSMLRNLLYAASPGSDSLDDSRCLSPIFLATVHTNHATFPSTGMDITCTSYFVKLCDDVLLRAMSESIGKCRKQTNQRTNERTNERVNKSKSLD